MVLVAAVQEAEVQRAFHAAVLREESSPLMLAAVTLPSAPRSWGPALYDLVTVGLDVAVPKVAVVWRLTLLVPLTF